MEEEARQKTAVQQQKQLEKETSMIDRSLVFTVSLSPQIDTSKNALIVIKWTQLRGPIV